MRLTTCSSRASMASSRRLSKLPGARLIEPMIARSPSARSTLACSLTCFSLWIFTPTSSSVRSPRHYVDLHSTAIRPDQVLDHYRILVALILQPQRILGLIDELAQPLPAIPDAPNQMGVISRSKCRPVPVRLKTLDDLVDFVFMGGNNRIVARHGEVFCLPIQRLDVGCCVVDNHRLLMRNVEGRVAVDHLDSCGGQQL